MEFVDTHTHISDEAFLNEEDAVIGRAVSASVTKMLQADIDSRERPAMRAAVERHPGVLFPMLGLYPGSVDDHWQEEIDKMLQYRGLGEVAMGEIGLDFHEGREFEKQQRQAFRVQLELAAEMGLAVNIHLRDATEDFFKIMEDCSHLGLRGNLHAFGGSWETFCRLQKYGDWYVGIGGIVTFKNSRLSEAVEKIPLDRILLETDAPYLAPTPFRGTRNESSMIPLIAEKIALIKGVSIEEVASTTTANAKKLFGI